MPKLYLKVPKELILEKELNEKRIDCFSFIYFNSTLEKRVNYSMNYMIEWCGFTPQKRKAKSDSAYIGNKFNIIMMWLYQHNYLINFNTNKFLGNNFQSSLINTNYLHPENGYGLIYDFEINKIREYHSTYKTMTKSILLLVLSYLRLKLWIRKNGKIAYTKNYEKDKPEICHKQIIEISNDLGISSKLISRAIYILEEFGIIVTKSMPRFKDEIGNWHTDDTIFANRYKFVIYFDIESQTRTIKLDKNYNYEKEISYGVEFLKEKKYYSRKFYQE